MSPVESNVAGFVLSHSVEARMLNMLASRLHRHPLNEHDEIIARAAYLDGARDFYVRGAADMRSACSDLAAALHQFEDALARIQHLIELQRRDT